MNAFKDCWYMAARHTMKFLRQPWYIGFALAQPIIYLCFFGQLFQRVANLPGFGGGSYVAFLTPGLVVMNAVFSAGWTGMGIIDDINRGIMDRFLITPAGRFSLIGGRLLSLGLSNLVQAGILLGLGWLMGARLQGGFTGVFVLLLSSILLSAPFAALSCAMGLMLRQTESVIGAVNFILWPLVFLSPVFMATALMPRWIQVAAQLNPVGWSATAARAALRLTPDWGLIAGNLALLLAFGAIAGWLATRAFGFYQRSL